MTAINYLGPTPASLISLGKINYFEPKKASALSPISYPGKDADSTEAVDTLGIIAYMNVRGRIVGKFQTIQDTMYLLRDIADGKQTSSQKFLSPFTNSKENSNRKTGNIGVNTSTTEDKLIDSNGSFVAWGISTIDKVKNLITGVVANVIAIDDANNLTLDADIFPVSGGTNVPYALTAFINVKVLEINYKWELPGLSFCDYELSLIQVN